MTEKKKSMFLCENFSYDSNAWKMTYLFHKTDIFLKGVILNTAVEILELQQHYQQRQESSKWVM